MLTPAQKTDFTLGALCLSVIAGLGTAVAVDAMRTADLGTIFPRGEFQAPDQTETRDSRNHRQAMAVQPRRMIAENTPRRGYRATLPKPLVDGMQTFPVTEASRSRR